MMIPYLYYILLYMSVVCGLLLLFFFRLTHTHHRPIYSRRFAVRFFFFFFFFYYDFVTQVVRKYCFLRDFLYVARRVCSIYEHVTYLSICISFKFYKILWVFFLNIFLYWLGDLFSCCSWWVFYGRYTFIIQIHLDINFYLILFIG